MIQFKESPRLRNLAAIPMRVTVCHRRPASHSITVLQILISSVVIGKRFGNQKFGTFSPPENYFVGTSIWNGITIGIYVSISCQISIDFPTACVEWTEVNFEASHDRIWITKVDDVDCPLRDHLSVS